MGRKRFFKTFLAVTLLIVVSTSAAIAGSTTIDRYIIGGGGGKSTAGVYTLDGTLGQPVAGKNNNGSFEVCTGFWCDAIPAYDLYLPIALKGY